MRYLRRLPRGFVLSPCLPFTIPSSSSQPSRVRLDCQRGKVAAHLDAGSTLLLFTDGLVERRGTSIRILVYDGQGFWLAQKRLSQGRFVWWPSGQEASRVLQAHQAQLLLAAGNPETEAAPVWRQVSL